MFENGSNDDNNDDDDGRRCIEYTISSTPMEPRIDKDTLLLTLGQSAT